jgi:hypothetical protein
MVKPAFEMRLLPRRSWAKLKDDSSKPHSITLISRSADEFLICCIMTTSNQSAARLKVHGKSDGNFFNFKF